MNTFDLLPPTGPSNALTSVDDSKLVFIQDITKRISYKELLECLDKNHGSISDLKVNK
jgi:hypothetical protein